jgi:hypothetical protein
MRPALVQFSLKNYSFTAENAKIAEKTEKDSYSSSQTFEFLT